MLVRPRRMRVVRPAMAGVVTTRMVRRCVAAAGERHLAEHMIGQLRGRARVHRTDAHDRWLADAEHEPDGEQCAEDASEEKARHSIGIYLLSNRAGTHRVPEGTRPSHEQGSA